MTTQTSSQDDFQHESEIPHGLRCSHCILFPKCERTFGCNPTNRECDFYPIRFAVNIQKYLQALEENNKFRIRIGELVNQLETANSDAESLFQSLVVAHEPHLENCAYLRNALNDCDCGTEAALENHRDIVRKNAKH